MILNKKEYTFDRTVRMILAIIFFIGVIWLLGFLSNVLIPFAIALLLAYLINPLVLIIQKKIHYHFLSVILSILLVFLVFGILGYIFIPIIIKEIMDAGALFYDLIKNSKLAAQGAQRLPENIWLSIKDLLNELNILALFKTENFLNIAKAVLERVLPGVAGMISGTGKLIIGIFGLAVILLYLVFILRDFQKLREGGKNLLPPKYKNTVLSFINDFNYGMKRYFRGQAVIAGTVGVLFAIGFTIIGLPMGIVLGLFIGLLNMIPYLQTLGFIPAIFLGIVRALETGGSFWTAILLVSLVFIVVQSIQDYFLVPKIMGKVTGFSPAMILLSISVWGKLLGFFGLIIALPMTALILAYYKRFLSKNKIPEIEDTQKDSNESYNDANSLNG